MSTRSDQDLTKLYRAGSAEEPPGWVDRAVLAAARDALPDRGARTLSRWMAPFALAAVVILSVSIALLMDESQVGPGEPPGRADVRSPERLPPRQFEEAPTPAASAPAAPPAGSVSPPTWERDAARSPTPRPAQPALPDSQPSGGLRDADPGPAGGSTEAERRPPAAQAPAPETPPSAGAPSAASVPEARADQQRQAAPEAARLEREQPRAERAARDRPAARLEQPSRTPAESVADSPERWLREIERLRREGREQEARAQLDAFRQRYPNHALPEGLMP